ncbi:ornithine uptake porin CarO [Acinetobacter junii]|uniref:ornithine uptake porin CarO n=1 Tax=Acinetobacter junii TaxID=40215 RepID=UPI001F16A93A|nr:ornithine uptake porin CarO [Acinetobacter junii]MCE6002825.1 ornithine uptake porin CarO [Acinetobacter junii]
MKALRVILAAGALTAIAGSALAADEQVVKESGSTFPSYLDPVSVRAEVGTTGYGGAISYRVNPYVGVTLGYNGGDISWSDDLKIDGTKYDMDMDNNNTYLNAEIYPWGASQNAFARALYVAAGVGYLDNDYKLTKNVAADASVKVDGKRFSPGPGGVRLDGEMTYDNNIAPYIGFGLNAPVYKNLGVFGEVGAYYTGNPTVSLNASKEVINSNGESLKDAVSNEEDNIANKSKYEWMPVAKVGMSFKF